MATAALYTPEVLTLATSLARWRNVEGLPWRGEARSPTCGSTMLVAIRTDPAGLIEDLGLHAQACAIGQAAAAIFAAAAIGRDRAGIARASQAIESWVRTGGAVPDWPGIEAIAAARDYPARHGAMLLPWMAALAALPSGADPS